MIVKRLLRVSSIVERCAERRGTATPGAARLLNAALIDRTDAVAEDLPKPFHPLP